MLSATSRREIFLRILILSSTPWSNDNSFGNSYSNIFEGIENIEIANIYCRYGEPNNNVVSKHFQITEKSLLKNLVDKSYPSGQEIYQKENIEKLNSSEKKLFDKVRVQRFQIYFWLRDIIWKVGRWRSDNLRDFIDDFKPDIIFQPLYYSNYLNDIALFIKNYTKAPMVSYVSDDVYTMKQLSFSPLYWIDRIIKRKHIKKIVEQSEYLYVISDIQKREYEKIFKKECKVLTKGSDFSKEGTIKTNFNTPLKLVYTGNIGNKRWKTLSIIAKQLQEINKKEVKAQLYIYSHTPINKKMSSQLNINKSSFFMGGVPAEDVAEIQKDADVLVHVESLKLREKLSVRQSFSTKLIDYFYSGRPILAVGPTSVASIDHLIRNNAAITASTEEEVYSKLNEMINDESILVNTAKNGWECGKNNHQITNIQESLYYNLQQLLI